MLVGQEFLDGDEAGDGEGNEGGQEGLLGDESDDEVGDHHESGKLHLQTEKEGQEGLHQLLLLSTTWTGDRLAYFRRLVYQYL